MAMIDNTLAAQVPTFNPATPLAEMAKLQAANQEMQQQQFKQNQLEIGNEMRGLQPFVNTPDFPAKWRETADRLRQRGVIDDQMHQQWANAPSPLLMKSIISKTEGADLAFRREEQARLQKNADRSYGLQARAANRLERGEVDNADDRATAAEKYGLVKGTPEYKAYVLGGSLATSTNKIEEEAAARERILVKRGMDPTAPQNQQFIATGKYPREDAQPLSAADKKVITSAEDEIPNLQGTIEALKTAKDLNTKTFTGVTAGARGYLGTAVPGGGLLVDKDAAMATSEFNKVMSGEAIKTMADTLKGATTDFELKKFETMLADPTTPPEIRGRTIDRMITLAERQKELKERRVSELRGGTYFKPNSGKPITQEEYAKLPRGSKYTAPDGSERTKQ